MIRGYISNPKQLSKEMQLLGVFRSRGGSRAAPLSGFRPDTLSSGRGDGRVSHFRRQNA